MQSYGLRYRSTLPSPSLPFPLYKILKKQLNQNINCWCTRKRSRLLLTIFFHKVELYSSLFLSLFLYFFHQTNNLERVTITTQQQKKLFELEYPTKLNKAKTTVEKYSKTNLKFDQMKQVVKDVIADIFYRGDYSMSDPAKKENSLDMQDYFDQSQTSLKPMTIFMLAEDFWVKAVGLDRGRYTIRANYMADACEKEKNCTGS